MSKQKDFILLRGLTREKRHWGDFSKHLQEFYPDSKIIELDLPGSGVLFKEATPLSVNEITKRLRKLVDSQFLDNENIIFVGVSLGGMVALSWAELFPKDLNKIILINSSAGRICPTWKRLRGGAYLMIMRTLLQSKNKHELIFDRVCENKENKTEMVKLWTKIQNENPVSIKNAIRQIWAASRFYINKRSQIPGLILTSKNDRLVNNQCSKELGKFLGWPIELHPWAGHELPDDDPSWVINEIQKFID